jgi:hypothetical protein
MSKNTRRCLVNRFPFGIIVNSKKGYSQHPETIRWAGHGWALRQRHKQLVCEMALSELMVWLPNA